MTNPDGRADRSGGVHGSSCRGAPARSDSPHEDRRDRKKAWEDECSRPWANAAASRPAGGDIGGAQREGQSVALAIIGRLDKESTTEDAAVWLDAQLSKNGVPKPINTFIKDEDYKGQFWARFPTVEAMDAAIEMFQNKTLTHGGGADGKFLATKTDHITRGRQEDSLWD